ncbi:megakaryocyte and platelet inhibitory receptor G6b isoform X4 [Arvicanthis niloticus]|uniref:megakaryocyte and platelet inhibitory receptor G6b isoform X4 n=1 Tax=Arvicanthis niloticus TaxID=61156 RepID=UPI001485E965|nr:megakaryocyte and platelet inhibitory receptor G6b isoform X2 [Arvicanthis niloticus]
MALVLQLLPLLLSKVQGNPEVSLKGNPGDRVNLSCIGVSDPTRWAWAPSFPACKGLSKGRRPILWASTTGTPTVLQHFSGRLRSLDTGIKRLELLLSAGDSGTFFCKGRQENESRTVLQVLGDKAGCRPSGSTHGSEYPKVLIPLLGVGLVLGLGATSLVWWRRSSVPPSHIAPVINAEPQKPLEQESKISGHLDQEPSLHYADLDYSVLGRHRRMSTMVPGDASTVYAVVV